MGRPRIRISTPITRVSLNYSSQPFSDRAMSFASPVWAIAATNLRTTRLGQAVPLSSQRPDGSRICLLETSAVMWWLRKAKVSSLSGESLAREMYDRFCSEIPVVQRAVLDHYTPLQKAGVGVDGTTSVEDCLMLYLLIRQFDRKRSFEIGTFIGTTAVAMT